jgi:hypothetical protein
MIKNPKAILSATFLKNISFSIKRLIRQQGEVEITKNNSNDFIKN